jgi:hypothetical protein
MMQSCLWQMVHTRDTDDDTLDVPEGSPARGRWHVQAPHGNAPLPPLCLSVSLEQLLAMQNELMILLMQNEEHRGA